MAPSRMAPRLIQRSDPNHPCASAFQELPAMFIVMAGIPPTHQCKAMMYIVHRS